MTSSNARLASSCVGEPGALIGETVFDLEGGGCIDSVLISGLLRLRLTILVGSVPLIAMWDSCSSIPSGDSRIVTPICCSGFEHCESSAVRRLGSIGTRGNVWLRGRFMLWPEVGRRCWLVGVKGLSDTRVEVGLVIPTEQEVVSNAVVLFE